MKMINIALEEHKIFVYNTMKELQARTTSTGMEGYHNHSSLVSISNEGLLDWIKDKLKKIGQRFTILINKIVARFSKNREKLNSNIEMYRKNPKANVQLAVSPRTLKRIILTTGAIAAAIVAITLCVKKKGGKEEIRNINDKINRTVQETNEAIHKDKTGEPVTMTGEQYTKACEEAKKAGDKVEATVKESAKRVSNGPAPKDPEEAKEQMANAGAATTTISDITDKAASVQTKFVLTDKKTRDDYKKVLEKQARDIIEKYGSNGSAEEIRKVLRQHIVQFLLVMEQKKDFNVEFSETQNKMYADAKRISEEYAEKRKRLDESTISGLNQAIAHMRVRLNKVLERRIDDSFTPEERKELKDQIEVYAQGLERILRKSQQTNHAGTTEELHRIAEGEYKQDLEELNEIIASMKRDHEQKAKAPEDNTREQELNRIRARVLGSLDENVADFAEHMERQKHRLARRVENNPELRSAEAALRHEIDNRVKKAKTQAQECRKKIDQSNDINDMYVYKKAFVNEMDSDEDKLLTRLEETQVVDKRRKISERIDKYQTGQASIKLANNNIDRSVNKFPELKDMGEEIQKRLSGLSAFESHTCAEYQERVLKSNDTDEMDSLRKECKQKIEAVQEDIGALYLEFKKAKKKLKESQS